ncbi:DUF4118 domain-containing protein, partial [Rhodoplanes sp. SY1]|uniref:DUF4118 domain-containing protein n=1 Tax=Rhodoplanes sp. SY1 TaxID=3166646 RepID=UPI0038B66227
RELALRRTAERVDDQLLSQMKARAIPGPWPAGERVLVCISEDPRSAGLVRYGKRLADRVRGPFTALFIESRRSRALDDVERDRIADTLRLAQTLGGEAATIPRSDERIADDIVSWAHANNVTQIVVGKSTRTRWHEIVHGSIVHDLVRRAGNISVHVIAGDDIAGDPIPKKTVKTGRRRTRPDWSGYALALGAIAVALGAGLLVRPWVGIETVDLVFLTAVVGVAVARGLIPSLIASVAASLCYNFFFLPPVHTFTITDPTNVAAFLFFTFLAI